MLPTLKKKRDSAKKAEAVWFPILALSSEATLSKSLICADKEMTPRPWQSHQATRQCELPTRCREITLRANLNCAVEDSCSGGRKIHAFRHLHAAGDSEERWGARRKPHGLGFGTVYGKHASQITHANRRKKLEILSNDYLRSRRS